MVESEVEVNIWEHISSLYEDEDTISKEFLAVLETADNLEEQAIEYGYSLKVAAGLKQLKLQNYVKNVEQKKLPFKKIIPVQLLLQNHKDWFNYSKEKQVDILWEMGLNTKHHRYYLDGACFNLGSRQECGAVIFGSERTDKKWLTMVVDGCNVASIEVRLSRN